jgi:hypothetical protein
VDRYLHVLYRPHSYSFGLARRVLHDYVRIPVLDRVHAKRLPAYAALGLEAPSHGANRKRHGDKKPARPTRSDLITPAPCVGRIPKRCTTLYGIALQATRNGDVR